jgi:hypothetical protein
MVRSKKVNDIKVSQFDEASAGGMTKINGGFGTISETEMLHLKDGKLRDRINLQMDLRWQYLQTMYHQEECRVLSQIYRDYETLIHDESFNQKVVSIVPKWYGIQMPKDVLLYEYLAKDHMFQGLLMKLNFQRSEFLKLGFLPDQIDEVCHGKLLIKDLKVLEQMEADWVKANITQIPDTDPVTPPETL